MCPPGTGVKDDCEPTTMFVLVQPGLFYLQKQQVFLTAEQSPQPPASNS